MGRRSLARFLPAAASEVRRRARAAAAGAGITLGLVGGATPAEVTSDSPVLLGEANTGTSATQIDTTSGNGLVDSCANGTAVCAWIRETANSAPALVALTTGAGNAVEAVISNAASSAAVVAANTNGTGNLTEALTSGKGAGVHGHSTHAAGHGVMGQGTCGATGLYGLSDSGAGVYAKSISGDALRVVGKVSFSRSGLASVAAKETSLKVTLTGVTASSMILATLQTDAGAVAVADAVPATGSFTIELTAAPARAVKVAWMVLG